MKKFKSASEIRKAIVEIRKTGKKIGFVPTMGALHEGHISLVKMAGSVSDMVVSSIFVNPVQFGEGEDFEKYPRDEGRDCEILRENGCDLVFIPDASDLFSGSRRIGISIDGLADNLCGYSRPGHFEGVLLIVAKLFNILTPDFAFFGQKDAQQALIIQRMAADLDFPVRIMIGPTVREEDGLALSSRNIYLSMADRQRATGMIIGLREAFSRARGGERDSSVLKDIVTGRMKDSGFEIDYVEIVDAESLRPVGKTDGTVLMAAAGHLSGTRLIDNIVFRISADRVEEVLPEFHRWSRYEE
ncbi:MAG: pantoate--beta-alanine ligase [Candidatus Krumholzibacteriota bacterium]|nr:pantoate--beta-alanine ligase [Candidatus Krumholzibacteriota bacterium]